MAKYNEETGYIDLSDSDKKVFKEVNSSLNPNSKELHRTSRNIMNWITKELIDNKLEEK